MRNENVDYIPFFTLQSEFASQTLILSNNFVYKEWTLWALLFMCMNFYMTSIYFYIDNIENIPSPS
jgi:hypothetical protein